MSLHPILFALMNSYYNSNFINNICISKRNRDTINNEDGLAPLIRLIATNHPALLVNVR